MHKPDKEKGVHMQKNTAMSSPKNGCDVYIESLKKGLPEFATTKDLVKAGIYRTEQAAAHNRRSGNGPEYFVINKRCIMYPKKCVIDFMEKSRGNPYQEKTK